MPRHHHLLTLLLAMAIAFFVSGCKSDSEDKSEPAIPEVPSNPDIEYEIVGTWKGSLERLSVKEAKITFEPDHTLTLQVNDGKEFNGTGNWKYLGDKYWECLASTSLLSCKYRITDDNLIAETPYGLISFRKVGNNVGGNTGGGSGSSSYETPDLGFYDYTAYPTKLKVQFEIYNQDKAKVTSATGYYGTSSASKSVAASVSGKMITVNLSGLSRGTKYKVKVTAKGPGGSATSETATCMTEY